MSSMHNQVQDSELAAHTEVPVSTEPTKLHFIFNEGIGEPVDMVINIQPEQIAKLFHTMIPDWLKSSDVDIPLNMEKDEQTRKKEANTLELSRIGLKSIVAGLGMLPGMVKDLRGPDAKMTREDSLPIISTWMSWFVASQIHRQTIDIEVVNGYIRDIRQGQPNVVRGSDTTAPCDNCP